MSGNMSFEEYVRCDAATLSGLMDKRGVSAAGVAATVRVAGGDSIRIPVACNGRVGLKPTTVRLRLFQQSASAGARYPA